MGRNGLHVAFQHKKAIDSYICGRDSAGSPRRLSSLEKLFANDFNALIGTDFPLAFSYSKERWN